ncbi:MAG: late competence development ComFB family protein [Crocosphaera sp.]|nr:late competence development ComFB family protein [Crocosphaera sp.]
MNYSVDSGATIHVNIMELLVREEIEQQLKFYPKKLRDYINKVEVATYALNRLPSLYASTFTGKEYQKRTGQQKYQSQITLAVRQALAAVQRDPLRQSLPLFSESDAQYELAKISLNKLEKLFKKQGILANNQKLSWNNLIRIVYPLITKVKSKKMPRHEREFAALTYVSDHLATEISQGPRSSQFKG